jgi:hypothetical protein
MRKLFISLSIVSVSLLGITCSKDSASGSPLTNTGAPASGAGGSMARFAIVGNYLYTVDKEKLKVFSIANAADPVLKRSVNVGFEIETIYPFKDKLFIGSTSVIHIFSIDDPENPQKLSTAISPTVMRRCDPVVAKDTVAYATLRTNGPCGGVASTLAVYDIRNVTNPILKTSIFIFEPYGLGYSDTVLYVCDRNRLVLYNIKHAYEPTYISQISGNWYIDVIPYNNTLICWVSDGVILFDITNRAAPQFIAKLT